jgi:hypothetical protein
MFVVDALARNFALELRKRHQHVEGKTTHAGGGVESLRHRDKRDVVLIEEFDQLGEVGKRTLSDDRPCRRRRHRSFEPERRPAAFAKRGLSMEPPEKPPSS